MMVANSARTGVTLVDVFQRFSQDQPLCVMTRAILGQILSPDLDDVFECCRKRQYESQLKFSLLATAVADVALGTCKNFRQAYHKHKAELNVSHVAFFGKLNRIEPSTAEGIVEFGARKSRELLEAMEAPEWEVLPGYKCSAIDGNHLRKTQKRLKVHRGYHAGVLPGQVVAKYNLQNQLFERAYVQLDAHAQESSVLEQLVNDLEARELLILDRHYCIVEFMLDVADRNSCFLVRHHGRLKNGLQGERREVGRIDSGRVYEQAMQIHTGERQLTIRRITLILDKATRDGTTEIHILSNVPLADATACRLAELYHKRWMIENAFHVLTMTLTCEIKSVGQPAAAIFLFCMALLAYNARQVLYAPLWKLHDQTDVAMMSNAQVALAINNPMDGMLTAIPESEWNAIVPQTIAEFAQFLCDVARYVKVKNFRKSVRGPKKPAPARQRCKAGSHVSTHRLLLQARGKTP